jgi:hypothetical protein
MDGNPGLKPGACRELRSSALKVRLRRTALASVEANRGKFESAEGGLYLRSTIGSPPAPGFSPGWPIYCGGVRVDEFTGDCVSTYTLPPQMLTAKC